LVIAVLFGAIDARADELPPVIHARRGSDAPHGYHHEERRRIGPLVAGGITTAMGVALIGTAMNDQLGMHGMDPDYSTLFYVEGGICLAVGVPLLLWGILGRQHVLVRNEVAVDLVPRVGSRGAALTLHATF
jgi:hypothetical protein